MNSLSSSFEFSISHMSMSFSDKWTNEKKIKSTLEYLEIQQNPIGTPHNILLSVKNRKYDIQKAEIKLRCWISRYSNVDFIFFISLGFLNIPRTGKLELLRVCCSTDIRLKIKPNSVRIRF
jgi:hypothetical protein